MTNEERWHNRIQMLHLNVSNGAVIKGKPCECDAKDCGQCYSCDFYKQAQNELCGRMWMAWLLKEAKEG